MICSGLGKLLHDPQMIIENNVEKTTCVLAIQNFRKNKSGEKRRNVDYLTFIAYGSGAKTIHDRAYKGDLMWFEAKPVQPKWLEESDGPQDVVFRLDKFQILNKSSDEYEDDDQ